MVSLGGLLREIPWRGEITHQGNLIREGTNVSMIIVLTHASGEFNS